MPRRSLEACGDRPLYCILSGENPALAAGELEALLTVYGDNPDIRIYTGLALICGHAADTAKKVAERAGYIRACGSVHGVYYREELAAAVAEAAESHGSVRIKIHAPHGYLSRDEKNRLLRRIIDAMGVKADVYGKTTIDIAGLGPDTFIVGLREAEQPSREYYRRRPSTRPFFRSIALSIRLSRAMINLSRTKPGDTLLDPFAGTGSIVIEACIMGIRSIGVDIDWAITRGCLVNLAHHRLPCTCILGDSVDETLVESIDAVVTDPPYGTGASRHGRSLEEIYRGLLRNVYDALKPRGRVVFLAPHYAKKLVDDAVCREGYVPVARYSHYVHNHLTRLVYVVEKP